jgi:geranylgeranyl diphosphate synthase type I
MNAPNPAANLTADMLQEIELDLKQSLDLTKHWLPTAVEEMIRYHLGWENSADHSGKRVRPLMTLLCCQAAGGDWKSALPAASAIEWIHNFSLIHDDIQDRSEIRRGRPTVWKNWGNAQAINTGDAVFALARLTTLRLLEHEISADKVLETHRILDETSIALTRGQHLDIAFEGADRVTTDEYFEMISGKTAALLGASCQIGALLSQATEAQVEAYRSFGHNLGLAFQVIDDLLGVWGKTETTGKSTADDLRAHKKTLPIIHGLLHSSEFHRIWSAGTHREEVFIQMRQLLDEAGSQEFTTKWAQRFTDDAMGSLEAAKPLEPAAANLSSLAARLLQRVA